jgi:hypothetical protein
MPTSFIVWVFSLTGLSVCLLSLWKGQAAERLGAWCILANLLISIIATTVLSPQTRPIGQLVIDAATALGLLLAVLRFSSLWLGMVMLLYAGQFTLHSFYFVTSRPPDNLHAAINNLDFLAVIVCLAVGTLFSMYRQRRAAQAA